MINKKGWFNVSIFAVLIFFAIGMIVGYYYAREENLKSNSVVVKGNYSLENLDNLLSKNNFESYCQHNVPLPPGYLYSGSWAGKRNQDSGFTCYFENRDEAVIYKDYSYNVLFGGNYEK